VPLLVFFTLALLQTGPCSGAAGRHLADAARLGETFDLAGAAAAYTLAAQAGCAEAESAAIYIRGLLAARAADAQFGIAASLEPVKQAIASLESNAAQHPSARAMTAVLRAAIPAAQHERAEMALRIEEMLRHESLQLEAKQPPLPVLSAHEAAGYFWLQLHSYVEAGRAFDAAGQAVGRTPHVMLGHARTAAGRQDPAACEHYRRLILWWGSRPEAAPEVTEAREYVKRPQCAQRP
jgi:hypothetical protein